ncbi:MAG TPA: M28 family peptidase [Bryobacteraceae bacterium]|nr:M28 family peptidase [Bryobacteraceae bacterium]
MAALAMCASAIEPEDLRAHVEFLASDALGGRATPSTGLHVASEYIAAQFRRAGLEAGNEGSYFQEESAGRRNVVGFLRGSDPRLRDTCVLVTAHYDHVGTDKQGEADDLIRNGANDNASGVASIIEIARDLVKAKPRRSVLFIAYYGEELGLIGSRYYAAHPLVPIDSTVAQINFEQTGRTDDLEGANPKALEMSGWGYSQVTDVLQAHAAKYGVRLRYRAKWSDQAFTRSDNEALAVSGVPAHTVAASFSFPDYHQPGDEWHKLDYDNMALITTAARAGVLAIANAIQPPHWYEGAPYGQKSHTPMSAPVPRKQKAPAARKQRARVTTREKR